MKAEFSSLDNLSLNMLVEYIKGQLKENDDIELSNECILLMLNYEDEFIDFFYEVDDYE